MLERRLRVIRHGGLLRYVLHHRYGEMVRADGLDIQLTIKGLKTLRESFLDYIQNETLVGDNKYMAEGYGLQDAQKGVIFKAFPPVLHLQLRRFEYDVEKDALVKVSLFSLVRRVRADL